jgi:hypothetical protein
MRNVPEDTLQAIQRHFHELIRNQVAKLIEEHNLTLPELAPLLTAEEPKTWFRIQGMHGGFSYWLEGEGRDTKLVTESLSGVVERSGRRHEITVSGNQLVEEGVV